MNLWLFILIQAVTLIGLQSQPKPPRPPIDVAQKFSPTLCECKPIEESQYRIVNGQRVPAGKLGFVAAIINFRIEGL